MKLTDIVKEITDTDTFQMYHGGKRWSRIPTELISSKKGRYEAGVGIYFTNRYETARSYAGGSRVVHLASIDKKFKRLDEVNIPLKEIVNFLKNLGGLRKRQEIINDLERNATRMKRDTISADILNNLIVNHEAGSGNVGVKISNFFVSNGADASIEGGVGLQDGEFWLLVFNPAIIKSVSVVDPRKIGSDFPFMLPRIDLH
jgi:hypothetical protein